MRRLILAALLAAMAGPGVALAADPLPYGPQLSFAAFRNGQEIGRHTLTFEQRGAEITVTTSVDFTVKVLGVTSYRYTHRSQEMWNGNTFLSLTSQTDDNGKKYSVAVKREASGLKVERSAQPEVVQAAAAYEGFRQPVQEIVPAQTLPSTQWNFRQVSEHRLLNTQYGTEARIQVVPVGRETIRTATGSLQATRYRYSGDLKMDQWFDDRGRWVKGSFVAHDGSTVEYILQE
jgi:hypothetical protein